MRQALLLVFILVLVRGGTGPDVPKGEGPKGEGPQVQCEKVCDPSNGGK